MEYKYKIKCDATKLDVNYINTLCTKHDSKDILLEFTNTKGMDTSVLKKLNPKVSIRIIDGYTEAKMKGAERADDYYERSIYTRDEVIKIVEKLEDIEKGIKDDWNDIQKVTYIFETLRRKIMYDHTKSKESKEIRSLRVLLLEEGVCAGYATVFKEIMDRLDIKCDYISGNRHAWNVVTIDGKKYPIDVTWGNRKYVEGEQNNFDYLAQDKTLFNKQHIPESMDPNNGYQSKLNTIDRELIERINNINAIEKDYSSTTYEFTREDGSKFIISQIGSQEVNGQRIFRYCYSEVYSDNTKGAPIILYSEVNLAALDVKKQKKQELPKDFEKNIVNVLFSEKNIRDSIYIKGTNYVGKIGETEEIKKDSKICDVFRNRTKKFYRGAAYISPGIVIQKMSEEPIEVEGKKVYYYDIFEYVEENGKEVLKRNRVFTEKDLFKETKKDKMVNQLLSRERLDRKAKDDGGYIGYLLDDGRRMSDRRLKKYFKSPSGKNKTNSELLDMLKNQENRSEFNSEVKYK